MIIKSIEYIDSIKPGSASGTGYSEPDKFHVICENGFEADVTVDIWYLPEELIKGAFKKGMDEVISDYDLDEAFEMYKQALMQTKSCPWFWMNNK